MKRKKKRRKNAVIEKNTYGKMHGDLAYRHMFVRSTSSEQKLNYYLPQIVN